MRVLGLFLIILFFSFSPLYAEEHTPEVSIITVLPGDAIHTAFGHSAIKVDNRLYNYGTFSFHAPGFLSNFVKGKMQYYLGIERFDRVLFRYIHREDRSIYEQKLNLTPEQTGELIKFLRFNARKENKYYDYEFVKDNCSSRIRDVLVRVLGEEITFSDAVSEQIGEKSYRDYIRSYLGNHPWFDAGIQFTLGTVADRKVPAEDAFFLPEMVLDQFKGCNLTGDSHFIYESELPPGLKGRNKPLLPGINPPVLTFSLLIAAEILLYLMALRKKIPGTLLKVFETSAVVINLLGGILLFYLMFFSAHFAVKGNLHILWLTPLSLILLCTMHLQDKRIAKVVATVLFSAALTSVAVFAAGFQKTCTAYYPAVIFYLAVYLRIILLPLPGIAEAADTGSFVKGNI